MMLRETKREGVIKRGLERERREGEEGRDSE